MRRRIRILAIAAVAAAILLLLRPESPTAGADCEALSSGLLREPVNALSSLAIVAAGWLISKARFIPGTAVLAAGAASFAAHASAHPLARALDGILALVAVAAVALALAAMRPGWKQIAPALAIAVAGVAIWALSRTGAILCDGLGAAGHATWHILIAIAAVRILRAGSQKAARRTP